MVRGRDAADGAMMTSFGAYDMNAFRVWTNEISGEPTVEDLENQLKTPPEGEPLTLAPTG